MQGSSLRLTYDYPGKKCLQEIKKKNDEENQKGHHRTQGQGPQEDCLVRDSVTLKSASSVPLSCGNKFSNIAYITFVQVLWLLIKRILITTELT